MNMPWEKPLPPDQLTGRAGGVPASVAVAVAPAPAVENANETIPMDAPAADSAASASPSNESGTPSASAPAAPAPAPRVVPSARPSAARTASAQVGGSTKHPPASRLFDADELN